MCYKKIAVYTNARFLSKNHVQTFVHYCDCGICNECINRKRSEWSVRSYYESKSLLSHPGNYILFDTLTYRDSDLKYFHDIVPDATLTNCDFMSFSRRDLQLFFKRLRSALGVRKMSKLHGKRVDCRGKIRYLVTSEYGSRPDCTHRPHYHVLFFVSCPELDPLILSRVVADCWPHGFTDGLAGFRTPPSQRYLYKEPEYVKSNRVFRDCNRDLNKVCNYVTKYITKDLYTFKKLYWRVFRCFDTVMKLHGKLDWCRSYKCRVEFNRLKNQVLPFHLQSRGFGLSAIDFISVDELISEGLPMVNSRGYLKRVHPCSYYIRKLFYQTIKVDGRLVWVPNEKYYEYFKKTLPIRINNFAYNYLSCPCIDINFEKAKELAKYVTLYRGRIMPLYMTDFSDEDYINALLDRSRYLVRGVERIYNYNTAPFRLAHRSFLSERNFHFRRFRNRSVGFSKARVLRNDLIREPVYIHSDFRFFNPFRLVYYGRGDGVNNDFENLLSIYDEYRYRNGVALDLDMYLKEKERDRLKEIGFVSL